MPVVQIEVRPLQAEQLSSPQPGAQGQFEQGAVAVERGGVQVFAGFGGVNGW